MANRDRIYYDSKYKNLIQSIKTGSERNPLGFNDLSRLELFKIVIALGINEPQEFSSAKEGLFLLKDLKTTKDEALLRTVLLGKAKTSEDIDNCTALEVNYVECEKCCNKGLEVLQELLEKYKSDDLLCKAMLDELETLYQKNVKLG